MGKIGKFVVVLSFFSVIGEQSILNSTIAQSFQVNNQQEVGKTIQYNEVNWPIEPS